VNLSEEHNRVYEWIKNELDRPVFAEAYKGAILMLSEKPPGYVTFVAHAGRDFMNFLASDVKGIKSSSGHVNYVQHVNELQEVWIDDWQIHAGVSSEVITNNRTIPIKVCEKISLMIEDHKAGQERDVDKAVLFFSHFLNYEDKDKIPRGFLSEWKNTKKWFTSHAHLRKGVFKTTDHEDLAQNFKFLHGYLYLAACSQYQRLKELNEILDAANN